MTADEIDRLPAGRDLNQAVHGAVMGRTVLTDDEMRKIATTYAIANNQRPSHFTTAGGFVVRHWIGNKAKQVEQQMPNYSVEIAAAWEVVEKVCAGPWVFKLDNWPQVNEVEPGTISIGPAGWEATFRRKDKHFNEDGAWSVSTGVMPALAVCRAALKAVHHEKGTVT